MEKENISKWKYHAVIPAAGYGSRFESDIPKQLVVVNGKPIIQHTVEVFCECEYFNNIVVVVPKDSSYRKFIEDCLHGLSNIHIVTGDSSRHRSIFKGLLEIGKNIHKDTNNHIVIIHDGVRPLVNSFDIDQVLNATKKYEAAGLVLPLVSTILKSNEDMTLHSGLNRSNHYASEMPQGFHLFKIIEAYQKCSTQDMDHGTECLEIMRKYSDVKAKLIKGDRNRLWKITYQSDIDALIKYWT